MKLSFSSIGLDKNKLQKQISKLLIFIETNTKSCIYENINSHVIKKCSEHVYLKFMMAGRKCFIYGYMASESEI